MPFLTGFKNKDNHLKVTLPERAETEVLNNCGGVVIFCKYWLFFINPQGLNAHLLMVVEITTASAASLIESPPHAKHCDGYLMY